MGTINDLYLDEAGFLICKENQTSKEWDNLLTELFKDWQQVKKANDDMDVTILNYSMEIVPGLKKEIEQLKSELKAAKSEGWDECSKEFDEHNITWCLWNINDRVGDEPTIPTNPYKQ